MLEFFTCCVARPKTNKRQDSGLLSAMLWGDDHDEEPREPSLPMESGDEGADVAFKKKKSLKKKSRNGGYEDSPGTTRDATSPESEPETAFQHKFSEQSRRSNNTSMQNKKFDKNTSLQAPRAKFSRQPSRGSGADAIFSFMDEITAEIGGGDGDENKDEDISETASSIFNMFSGQQEDDIKSKKSDKKKKEKLVEPELQGILKKMPRNQAWLGWQARFFKVEKIKGRFFLSYWNNEQCYASDYNSKQSIAIKDIQSINASGTEPDAFIIKYKADGADQSITIGCVDAAERTKWAKGINTYRKIHRRNVKAIKQNS